ncbi:acyl carrier protein [Pikeienuella sp. HZG-20]|uniref:acyl carrier protein n=1 Tax=Paludibacillus litoralis TaxID=3133267 RepID=UPI0030ED9F3D
MATLASVEDDIIRLLGEKVEGDLTLTAETNIVADTGLDSVSVMDFVFELEDEFGITVPLDRISDVKTVRQLAVAVHGLISESA